MPKAMADAMADAMHSLTAELCVLPQVHPAAYCREVAAAVPVTPRPATTCTPPAAPLFAMHYQQQQQQQQQQYQQSPQHTPQQPQQVQQAQAMAMAQAIAAAQPPNTVPPGFRPARSLVPRGQTHAQTAQRAVTMNMFQPAPPPQPLGVTFTRIKTMPALPPGDERGSYMYVDSYFQASQCA